VAPPRPKPRPREDDIPTVLPVPTLRGQLGELAGAMALAAVFALLGTTLWASLTRLQGAPGGDWKQGLADAGTVLFVTVAACWAVLIPGKLWAYHKGDSWMRRLVMMFLGVLVGLGALWANGWAPGAVSRAEAPGSWLYTAGWPGGTGLADGAGYVCYFALAFFALRWWRMADPRRASRFSFLPILAAGFWGLVPLIVWPQPWPYGAVALVMTAGIVQVVSPWEPPQPAASRRLRLRCC
jgi:hypothetical protein